MQEASQAALVAKDPPANQCRRCKRWGFDPWAAEIPLEKELATHSSILSWRILWSEEPGGLQSIGHKESDTTEGLTISL